MYTKYFILLYFFFFPFFCSGQLQDLKTLFDEAESAVQSTSAESLVRWLRVYDAAQEEDPDFLPKVCVELGQIFSNEELHKQALPYYQEALDVLSYDEVESQKHFNVYKKLGKTYAALNHSDSTAYFYKKILDHEISKNSISGQIMVLQEMVDIFDKLEEHQITLEHNLSINKLLAQLPMDSLTLLRSYNNLGYNYNQLNDYESAINYFKKAESLVVKKNIRTRIVLLKNIGIAYSNLMEYKRSIKNLKKARKLTLLLDPEGAEDIEHLMTTVFLKQKDMTNAMNFSKRSARKAREKKKNYLLTNIYYTSALIHSELYEYDEALILFQKHLQLKDSLSLEDRFRKQQILQTEIELERLGKELKISMINEEVQELTINQLEVEKEKRELELRAKEAQLEAEKTEKELLKKENGLKASQLLTQELETEKTRQALELARQRLIATQQDKELGNLEREKEVQALELATSAAKLETEQRAKELLERDKVLLVRDKEIGDLALKQQEQRAQFLFGLGALMTLLMLLAGMAWINSRRLNSQLNKKNKDIESQKEEIIMARNKSDQLLLNILPEETANELKENGFAVPKSYENATVLFTDFSGFTSISSKMSAEELIKELNICFQAFDTILEKHGLEKIKTIGDAYMCVSGVPVPNDNHSIKAIDAGKEIVAFMNHRIEQKKANGIPYWGMRMGIHSGPVIAGVVGKKKFAYDVWGTTVNTASRMESNGEPGRINISETTYDLVKDHFNCISRGKIMAKNIGEMGMYFVE